MGDFIAIPTGDGRTIEALVGGDPAGFPLLWQPGTPTATIDDPSVEAIARERGLRLITWSRPGYGGSTPRELPEAGPRIADDVPDIVTVLDHVGAEKFITIGWSGGGPRALACAALLPERCRAAATLAGVAPIDAAGLDWFADMAPENVAEFEHAQKGPEAYGAYLETEMLPMLRADASQIAEAMGELVTPVDKAFVTGEFAETLARTFNRAAVQGVRGARDDGLAILQPWGFGLDHITVPVAVWQGRHDAMVPYSHGVWLAENVAGAQPHLFDDEGHLTLVARLGDVLADLKSLASL